MKSFNQYKKHTCHVFVSINNLKVNNTKKILLASLCGHNTFPSSIREAILLGAGASFIFIVLVAIMVLWANCLLRRRASTHARILAITASIAFVYSLWAIGGSGAEPVYWGFLLLMAGLPVYVGMVRNRS